MKSRLGSRIFLPILLLALALMIACGQEQDEAPSSQAVPTLLPPESARPLTQDEQVAIDAFDQQLQAIDEEWDEFYQELDSWRSGLDECHPTAAQDALRVFTASFSRVAEGARKLPRTATTKELADVLITAADVEEADIRQLRDRWQPGSISLFESVEAGRAGVGKAQNEVTDLAATLQEELEDKPTADEVEFMEEFSLAFDSLADDWDDFHDDYTALSKRADWLEPEGLTARYGLLIEHLGEIVSNIAAMESMEINEDLVDELMDASEAELLALEFLAESILQESAYETGEGNSHFNPTGENGNPNPSEGNGTSEQRSAEAPVAAPDAMPEPPVKTLEETVENAAESPDAEPPAGAPTTVVEAPLPTPPPLQELEPVRAVEPAREGPSPEEQLVEVIVRAETVLLRVDLSIEEIVEDKSAEQLGDLLEFQAAMAVLVSEWDEFHGDFSDWRAYNGGCDQSAVAEELAGFSQQSGSLARRVSELPQSDFLLPIYALVVEAAQRDAEAVRTLANTWTPFAVDVFKAVDEERVHTARLRRQAGISLEELRNRP